MNERISSTQCIIYLLCFSLYGLVAFIPFSANLYSLLISLCIFFGFFSLFPLFFLTGGVDGMDLFFGYCTRPLILSLDNDFRLYTIQNVFSILYLPIYVHGSLTNSIVFCLPVCMCVSSRFAHISCKQTCQIFASPR
jgi:hypothetical protein